MPLIAFFSVSDTGNLKYFTLGDQYKLPISGKNEMWCLRKIPSPAADRYETVQESHEVLKSGTDWGAAAAEYTDGTGHETAFPLHAGKLKR